MFMLNLKSEELLLPMDFFNNLLSKIPFPIFGRSDEVPEHLFAVNISLSEIVALVWLVDDHKAFILSHVALGYAKESEIPQKATEALDNALGPSPIEPRRILFGVPDSWSIEDNLKGEYLKVLKTVVSEHALSPLAFVTVSHALSHFLLRAEGVVTTGILLGIGDYIEASLVRAGKIIDSRQKKKGDHLFEDIEEVLLQFDSGGVFPSKIIIYPTKSGVDLDKLKAELTSFPWMNKLSFLHFPKIEVLRGDSLHQAVVLAGATEIDPSVNLKFSFNPKQFGHHQIMGRRQVGDAGFVVGDIQDRISDLGSQMSEVSGFDKEGINHQGGLPSPLEVAREVTPVVGNVLAKASSYLPTQVRGILPHRYLKGSKVLVGVVLLSALLLVYLVLVKATVMVLVDPRVLEEESQVIADPKASSVDESKRIIPGFVVETSVQGSEKANATGQKQIGNPAKGKVVVYNLTNSRLNLGQGTVLTSDQGLKFKLDVSVQVASQSSKVGVDFTTVITPGKSDPIGVTAAEIGPDSNLSAGSELTVAGYNKSSAVARVDEALSGGTSKSVQVVTTEDQAKLKARLIDSLRQKAKEELLSKVAGSGTDFPPDTKVIPESLSVVNGSFNFTKSVNDQASEFSLNANVRFKGTSFSESDLKTMVAKLVSVEVPEGYLLNLGESETSSDVARIEKDGRLVFNAKFKAKLLPKFNEDDLKDKIRLRPGNMAVNNLKKVEHVIGAEIKLSPNLPPQFLLLPLLNSNISIIVSPK